MLQLSIILCTRLQLTIAGIVSIVVVGILQALFAVIMLEKYRANAHGKTLDSGDEATIMKDSVKSIFEPLIYTLSGLLIIAIALLFLGINSVYMLDGIILISLLTLAYTSLYILPKTNIALGEITRLRFEAYLSKNNSPAPTKNKAKSKKTTK